MKKYIVRKIYILFACSILISACSQFSNSPTSKAWHNLNARFNSLIIARTNMKEAEKALFKYREENYSALMPILVPIDSMMLNKQLKSVGDSIGLNVNIGTNLKEIIEKTSLIAERHSNSKYLGEAYILLGKARMMQGDYDHAIEIFKYINGIQTYEANKHAGLVLLMRTYIEQKDYTNALKVSEILRTLDLNEVNTKDFYLTKAYLHQKNEEFAISLAIAEEALKLMPKSEQKARVHYAVGQMYDLVKQNKKALFHFQSVSENRPNYDMEFYAKMNALLDESKSGRGNTGNVQENFKKMLQDRKNSDLKDKIYFTMAGLEVKAGNFSKAMEYFNASLKNAKGNSTQNAYTYLEIAEINYNQFQNYEEAGKYYDSTLSVLPKNASDYERIARRAKSLSDFVQYQKIIALEDSLQQLATLDSSALEKAFVQWNEALKAAEIAAQKEKENQAKFVSQNSLPIDRASDKDANFQRWVLYDPIAINRNKIEFQQIWGNRLLEDNWRRKDKAAGSVSFRVEKNVQENNNSGAISEKSDEITLKTQAIRKDSTALAENRATFFSKIPKSREKLIASQRKQEEAYYQLGKIYRFQLNEPENAFGTFETYLRKFPKTIHEPEVLYLMSLLNDAQGLYKQKLIQDYPSSTYARQLRRGKIENMEDLEEKAQTVYAQAFKMYENESFDSALILTEEGLIAYTGTSIEDKFAMLRILLLAKTGQAQNYQQALTEFIQGYQTSKLLPKAKELIAVFDKK